MNKTLILGSCAIESLDQYMDTAAKIVNFMSGKDYTWYYKGSFDKANRSTISGERGVGLDEAVRYFESIKRVFPKILLTTDVHETYQVEKLAGYIDLIQIPAFLCRQTDLITECAKHFKKINIKKGQWMSPENMCNVITKVREVNQDCQVWLTERGTTHGYSGMVVDFKALPTYKKHFDKVIFDVTHSTQFEKDGRNSGIRELGEQYFLTAGIFSKYFDGVFAETHMDPSSAISDQECQIEIDRMPLIINKYEETVKLTEGLW